MVPPPIVLFAHGAGAPSSSPWMQAWTRRLGTLGEVVAFDYPYMRAGRKAPDRLPALIEAHRAALMGARERLGRQRPFLLAGKSMGSRVGCHLANELQHTGDAPAALVCFGYPLRAGRTGALRDAVLLELRSPILFLQGARDPLCDLAELEQLRGRMTAPSALHVVEGGDHSLALRSRDAAQGRQEASDDAVLEAVQRFLVAHGLVA